MNCITQIEDIALCSPPGEARLFQVSQGFSTLATNVLAIPVQKSIIHK